MGVKLPIGQVARLVDWHTRRVRERRCRDEVLIFDSENSWIGVPAGNDGILDPEC